MWRAIGILAALVAVSGCKKEGPAEVPKNPVPMEKPGQAASPGGPANPQGAQPPQPLPAPK
jgi:hypothetical protein